MKKSTIYQELKNQFIYFFVAYEILKTNNLKLFAVLFLLLLIDVIYNSKNIIQGLTQINTSSELDTTSDLKKSKLNRILIAILFFGIYFLTYVLLVRKDFWILLF